MSQHDLVIDNQTFPATRADINSFLTAISTQQSGASDPPTTVQFQYFADTTNNLLKRRDLGDTAFLPFDTLLDSRVETKTANYTQLLADMNRTILLDASSGNLTVTLLDAAISQNGHVTTWKRIDSTTNTVLLDNFGGQTIDGVANLELIGENATAKVRSNGTNLFRESKVLGRPPSVISRIPIPFNPALQFTSTTFTRSMKQEGNGAKNIWDPSILLAGRVFLYAAFTGATGSPFEVAVQIVEDPSGSPVTVFETPDIAIGNQGSNEHAFLSIDVSAGNTTDLDLTSTLLSGINSDAVNEWEFNVRADIGSGGYFIRQLELQLLDY